MIASGAIARYATGMSDHPEQQYLDAMARAWYGGDERVDRTGVGTRALFGTILGRFDAGVMISEPRRRGSLPEVPGTFPVALPSLGFGIAVPQGWQASVL